MPPQQGNGAVGTRGRTLAAEASLTEVMFATSDDGLVWTDPIRLSGDDDTIDVFPALLVDQADGLHVLWQTTAVAAAGGTVEIPVDGTYPSDRVERPELAGFTARVVATATPEVYWGAWVQGEEPAREVASRFFTR